MCPVGRGLTAFHHFLMKAILLIRATATSVGTLISIRGHKERFIEATHTIYGGQRIHVCTATKHKDPPPPSPSLSPPPARAPRRHLIRSGVDFHTTRCLDACVLPRTKRTPGMQQPQPPLSWHEHQLWVAQLPVVRVQLPPSFQARAPPIETCTCARRASHFIKLRRCC